MLGSLSLPSLEDLKAQAKRLRTELDAGGAPLFASDPRPGSSPIMLPVASGLARARPQAPLSAASISVWLAATALEVTFLTHSLPWLGPALSAPCRQGRAILRSMRPVP